MEYFKSGFYSYIFLCESQIYATSFRLFFFIYLVHHLFIEISKYLIFQKLFMKGLYKTKHDILCSPHPPFYGVKNVAETHSAWQWFLRIIKCWWDCRERKIEFKMKNYIDNFYMNIKILLEWQKNNLIIRTLNDVLVLIVFKVHLVKCFVSLKERFY